MAQSCSKLRSTTFRDTQQKHKFIKGSKKISRSFRKELNLFAKGG